MSHEIVDYTRWIQNLCERDYGVREQWEKIIKEKELRRKMEKEALNALNRKK